jgi:aryl-alcohol dehydrogenase-like predicted oxidoreductase
MKYKIFGNTGLRVSELCLGTMTFGNAWGWGAEKATVQKIFDLYTAKGGNFIDTANLYSNGTSEKYIGELIKSERDHFVLGTKFTLKDTFDNPPKDPNLSGMHKKNMVRSVEASLKRLKTEYLDILWVHAWDEFTPVQELMKNLELLVQSGKVQHIAISDSPAWRVSQANTLAELKGWTSFAGLQVEYSLIQRSAERDLIPMANEFGLTITPWSPLGGGILSGKYLKGDNKGRANKGNRLTEKRLEIAQAVVDVANRIDAEPSQVAIKWMMQKHKAVIPIIGARTAKHLKSNMGVLDITIPESEMTLLDEASAIELGFPHDFLKSDNVKSIVYSDTYDDIIK